MHNTHLVCVYTYIYYIWIYTPFLLIPQTTPPQHLVPLLLNKTNTGYAHPLHLGGEENTLNPSVGKYPKSSVLWVHGGGRMWAL